MTGWMAAETVDCPCRWGPCGHCTAGRHDACAWVRTPGYRSSSRGAHTSLCVRTGDRLHVVMNPRWMPVWVTGERCAWVCACHRLGHGHQAAPQQLDLFEEVPT